MSLVLYKYIYANPKVNEIFNKYFEIHNEIEIQYIDYYVTFCLFNKICI